MNLSLAKGYATQAILSRKSVSSVDHLFRTGRMKDALNSFENFSFAKKPGRVLSRVRKRIGNEFKNLYVQEWTKKNKILTGYQVSSLHDAEIFSIGENPIKEHVERSLVLSTLHLMASTKGGNCGLGVNIQSHISHHALSRLLQRNGTSPETIDEDVDAILNAVGKLYASIVADNAIDNIPKTGLPDDPSEDPLDGANLLEDAFNFLFPYKDGALIIRFVSIASQRFDYFSSPRPTLSVRTYLDPSMITEEHTERMEGFPINLTPERASIELPAWIRKNARKHICPDLLLPTVLNCTGGAGD